MAFLAALALRQRRGRRQNRPQVAVSNELRPEVPAGTGDSQRAARSGDCGCNHDPASRAIANFICKSVLSSATSSLIDKKAGNGLGSELWVKICSSERLLLVLLIVIRIFNCLLVQTSYVPDEYWQSVEVAHKATFGYGYLTWEWKEKIRSFLYPAVFACAFKAMEIVGVDSRATVVLLPRLMQSILAALGDLCLYRLSCRLAGSAVAQCSLLCQLLSWYTFYTCTRTLANSTEVSLTTIALSYYPFKVADARSSASWKFLWLAALTCMIRPTAAVIWVPLCMGHVWACRHDKKCSVLIMYTLTAVFFLLLCLRIDKSFYGEWVLTPYNFFKFNVLSNLSSFYGVHPWHWYFTQGLPAILGPHMVVFAASLLSCQQKQLQVLVFYIVFVYSFLPHKEFRFISPIMPVVMHLCGYWITAHHQKGSQMAADQVDKETTGGSHPSAGSVYTPTPVATVPAAIAGPTDSPAGTGLSSEGVHTGGSGRALPVMQPPARPRQRQSLPALTTRRIFVALAAFNLPLMAYFSLLHQRGGLDVMAYLHAEYQQSDPDVDMAVLFLMPCHSTPFYSHLHANVSMRFLTCEPPSPGTLYNQSAQHKEEAEEFYRQPLKWLKTNVLHGKSRVPTHLVIYDTLQPNVSPFIEKGQYVLARRFFHTHFPSGRVGREVLVYRRSASVVGASASARASVHSSLHTEPKQAADEHVVLPSFSA